MIATQNPHEHEGVFLPEGQLDRFLFKIELDYADAESEPSMLNLPHKGIARTCSARFDRCSASSVSTRRGRSSSTPMSRTRSAATSSRSGARRELPGVDLGVSSRAMIHLVMAVKANARLNGRDTATIEDVREMAPYVLRHRISVAEGTSVDTVLLDAMSTVPSALPPHRRPFRPFPQRSLDRGT